MLKKTLLLFSIIFFTGCVERGYKLTVNKTTQTVTAIKTVDINTKTKETSTQEDMQEMDTAVKKVQKKQPSVTRIEKKEKKISKNITKPEHKEASQKHEDAKKEVIEKEVIKDDEKNEEIAKRNREKELQIAEEYKRKAEKEREILRKKLAAEKKAKELAAEKEREALAKKKIEEEKIAQEKEAARLAQLKEKDQAALREKIAKEKEARLRKEKEDKLALERKIEEEKKAQQAAEKKAKIVLERKLAKEKRAEELKRAEALKKQKAEELKKAKDRKAQLKKTEEEKIVKVKKPVHKISTAESLIFKPTKQVYQKFGTSEIHGHVVYMTQNGREIPLKNTKIYLIPKNTKVDYWYSQYYLKNKESSSLSKTIIHYLNATHLNLEKNFAFYGLAPGTYYVIIESDYPSQMAKNKKVYIAKKIIVEKYKKIMTVFSKKLLN